MKLALKLFILILALAVLGTYVIAKIREARIEARYPPIGQTVKVNGKKRSGLCDRIGARFGDDPWIQRKYA
jgi:hypothetical protein